MPVLSGASMQTEVQASKPNLEKLLKHTEFHPNGRVQIDENGEVVAPKHNVIRIDKKPVYISDTQGRKIKIRDREIIVNGGHVKGYHPLTGKQEDCVWRMGHSPKKHHELLIKQAEVRRRKGNLEQVAPDLEQEEAEEYAMYLAYLQQEKKKIAKNIDFYKWVKENDVYYEEGEVYMRKEGEDGEVKEPTAKASTPKRGRPKKSDG